MGDSHNFKAGSRPGGSPPARPAAAGDKPQASPRPPVAQAPATDTDAGRAGRVVHDARGNAVWDWVKDTTRIAIDSTSRLLKKLEVPELKMEDTQNNPFSLESDRDVGGGYDPYGSSAKNGGRGPPKTPPTGRHEGPSNSARHDSSATPRSPGKTNNPGGGYDPYGKGVTRKPGRKF